MASPHLPQRFDRLLQTVAAMLACRVPVTDTPVVLVGISGGADSTFLLHLLHALAQRRPLHLHGMHVDHGLRPDSPADACFAAALARTLDIPFHGHTLSPGDIGDGAADNLQAALRRARYRVLSRTALALAPADQVPIIATGHHAGDQAETVLMNLIRGSSLQGLRGIRPWQTLDAPLFSASAASDRRLHLFRPLLTWERSEIEGMLRHWNLAWRNDPSNRNARYVRNRLRHQVLPMLEQYNPRFIANLARQSQAWGEELDGIRAFHDTRLAQLSPVPAPTLPDPQARTAVIWDLLLYRQLPVWQRKGLLQAALRQLRPDAGGVTAERIQILDRALAAASRSGGPWPWFARMAWSCWRKPPAALCHLPAVTFLVSLHWQDALPFVLDHPRLPAPDPQWQRIEWQQARHPIALSPPGPGSAWVLTLRERPGACIPEAVRARRQPWRVWVDMDCLAAEGPYGWLGGPAAHNRMQPLGMDRGSKALGRILRDRRVHASLHAVWPTLYTAGHTAVWLCGVHMDRRFAVGPHTRRILEMSWQHQEVPHIP